MGVILSYSCFEHSSMLTEGDIYAYMQTCFTFLKRSKKTKETHQGCQRWPAISWGRFYPGSLEAPHPSPRSGLQLYKKNPRKLAQDLLRLKIHITSLSIYQRTTSTNDQAELSVNRMSTSSTKSDQNPRTENSSSTSTTATSIITTNQVQFSPSQRRPSPPAAPSLPSSSSWLPWSPKDLEIRKQLNMYEQRTYFIKERKRTRF